MLSLVSSRPGKDGEVNCAGGSCAPTPRTCSSDDLNKLDCRRIIRLTHFGRPASRIFWKMTALWKPLSESPATPTQPSTTVEKSVSCNRSGFFTPQQERRVSAFLLQQKEDPS
jgi:hypothetical protein